MQHSDLNSDYKVRVVMTNHKEIDLTNISIDDQWITGKNNNGEIISINVKHVLFYKQSK